MPALSAQWKTKNLGRFGALLVALVLTFLVAPFFPDRAEGVSAISVLYTLVMTVGAYAVSRRRKVFWIGLAIVTPALAMEWISNFVVTTPLVLGNMFFVGVFIAFVAVIVLYEVLDENRVTLDTIFGGIAVYLLIGLGWVLIYAAIEYTSPGAFLLMGETLHSVHPELQVRFPEFLYFSFVTMTTLGYGDMVPVIPQARAMASAQAIVGQLYIAIFVARLVGLHIAHSQHRRGEERD